MIFLNSEHELRAGWKFVAYVVFFLLIWVATGIALTVTVARSMAPERLEDQLVILAFNEVALFVPAVAAMWLIVRFVDRRPLRAFGVGFLPNWRADFLFGLALAAGMLAALIGGCYAFGHVSIHWTANQVPLGVLAATLGLLIVAAANEELVFRGLPLQLVIDAVGEWPAIIGMSALFGVMHLGNDNVSWLGVVNTIVAGILLSLAFVRTRSLWMPFAIHIGWNAGLGFVFGFPLSGYGIASLWKTGTAGSEHILGGGYGPEGGLLATFIFGTAALIVNKHGPIDSAKTLPGSRTGRLDRG